MNYAEIYKDEICNGTGVGVSLFVSGCDMNPKCKGCFNSKAWDYNAGKPFTEETQKRFLDLADKSYIDRITIIGGEPLAEQNFEDVEELLMAIRSRFGKSKKVWVFTGRTFEEVYEDNWRVTALEFIDVLVDGRFDEIQKDLTIPFRGSRNQRLIDVPATLNSGSVTLLDLS